MKPQAFVIALIVIAVALIANGVVQRTDSGALRDVMTWLSFCAFLPFGLAVGAAMTNSKVLLVTTTIVTVLIVAPKGLQPLSRALAPLGAGVLIGAALTMQRRTNEPPPA